MIEFLTQMPTDTMISLAMAVLGLATVPIVLSAPPGLANRCIDLCRLLARRSWECHPKGSSGTLTIGAFVQRKLARLLIR